MRKLKDIFLLKLIKLAKHKGVCNDEISRPISNQFIFDGKQADPFAVLRHA